MLRQEEIEVKIGRVTGGTFVRVTHVPTGITRSKGPLAGESVRAIEKRFLQEIESELVGQGLREYVAPAYKNRYGEC